jgi:hypothetical protein
MSPLYKTRYFCALYRLYGNLRSSYLSSNQITSQELTANSGLVNGYYPSINVLNSAFQYANPASTSTTNYEEIQKFIDYCTVASIPSNHSILSTSEADNLIGYSRSNWDSPNQTDTTGSYTIVFNSGKTYVGKGNRERCRISAKERCDASPNMDNGKWGDHEGFYINKPSTVSASDQAFKEEQIKIWAVGGPLNNTYNAINSPGLSKINSSLGY